MNNFRNAVADAIHSEFGDDFAIYSSFRSGDFNMPAFVIEPVIEHDKHFMSNRFYRDFQVKIRFFCPFKDRDSLYCQVSKRLTQALEYIIFEGDSLKGSEPKFRIQSDNLEICLDYGYFYFKKYSIPYMEKLTIHESKVQL